MCHALSCSDLYIGRAGGSIIAELLSAGVPAIFIPYPFAKDDHQEKNARYLAGLGTCIHIPEKDYCAEDLIETMEGIIFNEQILDKMKKSCQELTMKEAAVNIARELISEATKKNSEFLNENE
jgi:UDP-N-acetylglucosamine--N-acetylmuramyl-(pentapeptide) pyrophosphoryl-undecaprenol N-acetylglucosamine transferase